MAISSISTSVPQTPPQAITPQAPQVKNDGDGDIETNEAANSFQPTPPAPLPPGQGTRVDQLA